jgi:hypothetical protein
MKYLILFLILFLNINVFAETYLLSHEKIQLGESKEEILKKITAHYIDEYERAKSEMFPKFKTQYTDITDSTYYEIGGVEFTRYLKFEENRLININLSSTGQIFLSEIEMKNQTKKLINLFIKKAQTLSNEETFFNERKLENMGQIFSIVGDDVIEDDCYFDGSNTIETTHSIQLDNSEFILKYQSSPCYPNGKRYIITYDFFYELVSLGALIEERRIIKQSKL